MRTRAQSVLHGSDDIRNGGLDWLRTWRSFEEPAETGAQGDPAFAEFESAFSLSEATRRDVLRVMAASLAVATASGCGDASSPPGEAVPYVTQPEQQVPSRPRYYATATLFEGFAQPVLVEAHEGRPTKIEGNPDHPIGNGGTDAFMQAAVLQFYDPDRSQTVQRQGRISTWGAFERELLDARQHWDETGGAGLRLLTGATTSPTFSRQLDRLLSRWPKARWHSFEPVGSGLRDEAMRLAFGEPLSLHYALQAAEVIVALDDDVLGPGPQQVRNTGGWAARRRAALRGDDDCRIHVAEPTPTLTGAMAHARLPVEAGRIAALTSALAHQLGVSGQSSRDLDADESEWVRTAAQDLRVHAGRCLVAVGPFQPPEVQALGFGINQALGNFNRSLLLTAPLARPAEQDQSLSSLAADMAAGAVKALIVLEANPAYASPVDIDFVRLLDGVPLRVHAGIFYDETAEHSHWHLPLSHSLESWSDARALDGTTTIVQPVARPLYNSRGIHELMALLLAEPPYQGREIVAQTWQPMLQGSGDPLRAEERWRSVLRRGFIENSALSTRTAVPGTVPMPAHVQPTEPADPGMEVVFRPDPCIWDGRFANCAWLQELPKPFTKLTWDNVAALSPGLAGQLGVRSGELLEITANGNRIVAPAWILPGQAERSITVFLGYGRSRAGTIGNNRGYDAYRLRPEGAPWMLDGARVKKLDKMVELATTQTHSSTEGHEIVGIAGMQEARADKGQPAEPSQPSLYEPMARDEHAWAMAIDLDLCIGCNACVIACQAENNVPSVGKQQVRLGREMHWLRVDRYYAGPVENPETYFMPVPCMHCEKAPCELGCPVNATVHGDGGLNEMVYNRCIGTRTCSSYCPYKVRRFNWFNYTRGAAPSIQAQRNPNVTVRDRGVMEKCTFCIQRIAAARIDAEVENRSIRDGEVVPACQAACPTTAIMFGDLNDPESRVGLWKASTRNYPLLGHLGTRPRTTYLARVKDDAGQGEG